MGPVSAVTVVDGERRYALHVFDLGLACCAVEVAALASRGDARLTARPAETHVMVISGTLTDVMAPALRRHYEALPEPRVVISFGACSNTGGPYWDSYSVTKGADHVVPVDVYVPGCPPRPEALLAALRELAGRQP